MGYKLIVWGMGKTAKRFQRYLRDDCAEIIAFTGSDVTENLDGEGVERIRAVDIGKRPYDHVIVASFAYQKIESILLQMGVSKEKIHQVYDREKYQYDEVIREITYWNFTCSDQEYEIGKYRIDLGYGHMLSQYQREYPMYDRFLGELSKHLPGDNWAVDIGANVGDSVFLLRKHSDIRVLAVEPAADYYRLLCKNTAQLTDVYTEKCMISMNIMGEYRLIEHNGTAFAEKSEKGVQSEIPVVTLRDLLAARGVEPGKVRMVKIDTDGFDAECIMSLGEILNQINAFIYFENYFDSREAHDKYEQAYRFLTKKRYTHFFIFDNFGNFLCEGNADTVKEINNYLLRAQRGDSARTMGYIDILTVKEELYQEAKSAVEEYIRNYDDLS